MTLTLGHKWGASLHRRRKYILEQQHAEFEQW